MNIQTIFTYNEAEALQAGIEAENQYMERPDENNNVVFIYNEAEALQAGIEDD